MEWLFLEVFIAFAIGIAIVWWTMAPSNKRDANGGAAAKQPDPGKTDKS